MLKPSRADYIIPFLPLRLQTSASVQSWDSWILSSLSSDFHRFCHRAESMRIDWQERDKAAVVVEVPITRTPRGPYSDTAFAHAQFVTAVRKQRVLPRKEQNCDGRKNSEINYRARFNSLPVINRVCTYNTQRNSRATNGASWTRRSIRKQVCTFHVTGGNRIVVNNDCEARKHLLGRIADLFCDPKDQASNLEKYKLNR